MHNSIVSIKVNSNKYCLAKTKLVLICGLLLPAVLQAQPHDPIEELFRFGQNDHLIIDRGGPVDAAGDVNGDGIDDIIVGSGAGGVRVIFGPTNGNNGTLNGQQIDGISGFNIVHDTENLSVVAGIGDLNADGFDDILVGTITGAHVVFGKSGGFTRNIEVDTFDGLSGFSFNASATSVSSAGDVNNDGIVDMLVGNANASVNNLTGVGATYVIYGKRGRFPTVMTPSVLDGTNGFVVIGTNAEGDFNHDGVDDFLIGAPNKTQSGVAEVGEAYMVYGRSNGFPAAISLSDIDGRNGFVFKGSNIQDSAGSAVTGIGDLNHDGIDDIAISAPGKGPFGSPSDYPGETYILFGGQFEGTALITEQSLNGANGFVARGIRGGVVPIEEDQAIWGDLSGTSVDGAGDYNDDGIDDLLIGASHTIINPRRKGVGQIYIIYGTTNDFPSRLNLTDLDGDNGFRINGIGTVDYFGVYVRTAGDFNDDGKDDVIVGASGQGNSYVIYGRDPWAPVEPAPQPVPLNTALSPGFASAAFVQLPDARPLAFNELADPTGPTPLPPGTPTVLGDPATPGDIPPNVLAPVEPLRPEDILPEAEEPTVTSIDSDEGLPVSEPTVPVTPTITDPIDPSPPVSVASEPNGLADTDVGSADDIGSQEPLLTSQAVQVGSGASVFFPLLLILLGVRLFARTRTTRTINR